MKNPQVFIPRALGFDGFGQFHSDVFFLLLFPLLDSLQMLGLLLRYHLVEGADMRPEVRVFHRFVNLEPWQGNGKSGALRELID